MTLNQITVACTDLQRAIGFYETLGLIRIVENDHYARFACPDGDSTFSLHCSKNVAPSETAVYFECDDLDGRVERLRGEGVAIAAPVDQPWLWREAWTQDPDGNRVCLFFAGENRLNPPWRLKR